MLNLNAILASINGAGIPAVSVNSAGRIDYAEGVSVTPKQTAQAEAILDKFRNPPTFEDVQVFSAFDVDRVTIARIFDVLRPGAPPDLQAGAEMRQVKDILAGLLLVVGFLTQANGQALPPDVSAVFAQLGEAQALNAKVEAIRQEGIDFKKAQGWLA